MVFRRTDGAGGLRRLLRLEDLVRRALAQRRLRGFDQTLCLVDVGLRERARRATELDQGAAGVVRIDRGAPAVVDLDHVVTVVEQALSPYRQVVDARRRERDVVHPCGQAEPATAR